MIDNYKAVIFDLDGVLVNSEKVHMKAWGIVLRDLGYDIPEENLMESFGLSSEDFAKRIEEWGFTFPGGRTSFIHDKRRTYEKIMIDELERIPGADEFIRSLQGKARIGLCSASNQQTVQCVLEHFGWQSIFETVVTFESTPRPKPHPDMYLEAMHRLESTAEETLAFEDSPTGVKAARGAGIRVIGLSTSFEEDRLRELGVNDIISDFKDPLLHAILARSGQGLIK